MRLSPKLLGFLNRAFDKDPDAFLALRLQYDGAMSWRVADGVLTTSITGGSGAPLTVELSGLTIRSLAGWLSIQTGYSVPFVMDAAAEVSALRLIEAQGDPSLSNGDHLLAYGSLLYALIDPVAAELSDAEKAIAAMPDEMATTTASGSWLDYLGSFYAVPRLTGEMDPIYARRIITEVLRPLGNNLAIEQAIADYTGQQVSIVDVIEYLAPEPLFSGLSNFDGSKTYQPASRPRYGQFDAVVGYDLLGGDVPTAFLATIRGIIGRIRDAGYLLRAVELTGSTLDDTAQTIPVDDQGTLVLSYRRRFDGMFSFDGSFPFAGAAVQSGTIAGE